jgi:hypothetical protein
MGGGGGVVNAGQESRKKTLKIFFIIHRNVWIGALASFITVYCPSYSIPIWTKE